MRRAAISRLRRLLVFNGADVVDAMNDQNPKKGKAGRLGERPAFLLSPPGCGVIEALGCVGRGFDERPGETAGGLVENWELWSSAA